ncbi:hypothetical protein SAMN05428977_104317 [Nitrosomonas sp. Nm166]|nr:hypothetical protein SAMN05428977_104317 [Nitrosomonas sp. Nm166]
MNRDAAGVVQMSAGVPHARGDEPVFAGGNFGSAGVFPTPVGMNRAQNLIWIGGIGVPHARGDEPAICGGKLEVDKCSPRPWG